MAEGGALLRRYTGKTRIEGSNPSLSARSPFRFSCNGGEIFVALRCSTLAAMKTTIRVALCMVVLLAAGCSLPEGKSGARVCIQDSGFCWFPDD